MIWIDGRILPDAEARLTVADRALEHGVGLFETMRAHGGRVPLLDRHLDRMRCSAAALGIAVGEARLPRVADIAEFLEPSTERDWVVRLTLSGGSDGVAPRAWLTRRPLPNLPIHGVRVEGRFHLEPDDELARHKTLNHWRRRRLMEGARAAGVDERIGRTPDGRLWEAIWANLFVVRDGVLRTPSLDGPILPGIMRRVVIERARALGLTVVECDVRDGEPRDEAFLTNAVRGVVPVALLDDGPLPAPGPLTAALQDEVESWLSREAGR